MRELIVQAIASCGASLFFVSSITASEFGAAVAFSDQTGPAGVLCEQVPSVGMQVAMINVSRMISGGAVGDFNNDGWQDFYVVGCGGEPDRLFMNTGDGTFIDQAEAAGIAGLHMGIGAAVGDYDNDGFLDIFVTSYGTAEVFKTPEPGHHKLWRNNGDGTFTDMAQAAGVTTTSITIADGWGPAFGDYDLDGDLDLYVPHWLSVGNVLFRNNGDGTFTKVTQQTGLQNPGVRGFAGHFVDMNGDLYPELLVAADFGTSRYYVNNGDGTFTDATAAAGTGLDGNGMGQAVGDLNNDGLFDWYVTSIYSDRGSGSPVIPGTGNMLYMNQGDDSYHEVSVEAGVNDGGWGWGAEAVDVNHDGLLDLIEVNGYLQGNEQGALEWDNEPAYLFVNNGDGTFTDLAGPSGFIYTDQGRGMMRLDIDNDGDQDIVILTNDGPIQLNRNDLEPGEQSHWIRIVADTSGNHRLAPNGYGVTVTVRAGEMTWTGHITGGSRFLAQSELSAHFGLGSHDSIDELRMQWTDGTVSRLLNIPANQHLVVESGDRNDINSDGALTVADLLELLAYWGTDQYEPDLNADGEVNAIDLNILLNNWL